MNMLLNIEKFIDLPAKWLPVKWNCCQCKNAGSDTDISNKIADSAVDFSKWPIIIEHIYEIEDTIQNGQK